MAQQVRRVQRTLPITSAVLVLHLSSIPYVQPFIHETSQHNHQSRFLCLHALHSRPINIALIRRHQSQRWRSGVWQPPLSYNRYTATTHRDVDDVACLVMQTRHSTKNKKENELCGCMFDGTHARSRTSRFEGVRLVVVPCWHERSCWRTNTHARLHAHAHTHNSALDSQGALGD